VSAFAYDIVVPTIGRPSLESLLVSLARARGPLPQRVIVVDDRRDARASLAPCDAAARVALGAIGMRLEVVSGSAAGPASARNRGWRAASSPWVAFLDDDVVVHADWFADLASDIAACDEACVGTQGHVTVPRAADRPPTDWERNVAALEGARWITADFAFRRRALDAIGGFDERFPRAFREDADLALRIVNRGWTLAQGRRRITHPVRPADAWVSVRLQAGNADDALMDALHGRDWYERAASQRGEFATHVATAALGIASLLTALGWFAATLRFAWVRIAPGPRDPREIRTMLVTSAVIPFAAVYHRVRGMFASRGVAPHRSVRSDAAG